MSDDDLKRSAQEAGDRYHFAVSMGQEDLERQAMKYLLLRLMAGGLHGEAEVETLRALAGAAFVEADVTSQAGEILKAKESSPLAVTLANVVVAARGSKRTAMIGAVLGAHAASLVSTTAGEEQASAMQGAIVGAAIFETRRILDEAFLRGFFTSD